MIDDLPLILARPDWPVIMRPIWSRHFYENIPEEQMTEEWKREKRYYIELMKDLLSEDQVYIAERGQNDDRLRKPIDKIIIHHSHSDGVLLEQSNQGILNWINALQLIRQYGDYFSNPVYENEYNKPIFSGHYLNGRQVFIAYHWLVFPDGKTIQTLQDEYLGWHCKGHNTSSIGICLIGDFTRTETPRPNSAQLEVTKAIIKKYQATYAIQNIFGHGELLPGHTTCPGTEFLGEDGWKKYLM